MKEESEISFETIYTKSNEYGVRENLIINEQKSIISCLYAIFCCCCLYK